MADCSLCLRLVWAFLSVTVAVISTLSYCYLMWLEGEAKLDGVDSTSTDLKGFVSSNKSVKFSFSTFRRCNHWTMYENGVEHRYKISENCRGYMAFRGDNGIPSGAWRTCTIVGGIGWSLLDLVAPLAVGAIFVALTKVWAVICGFMQAIAGQYERQITKALLGFQNNG